MEAHVDNGHGVQLCEFPLLELYQLLTKCQRESPLLLAGEGNT